MGINAWGTVRVAYLTVIHEEFEERGIDSATILGKYDGYLTGTGLYSII